MDVGVLEIEMAVATHIRWNRFDGPIEGQQDQVSFHL